MHIILITQCTHILFGTLQTIYKGHHNSSLGLKQEAYNF